MTDRLTLAGGRVNEDRANAAGPAAWVIDGATGLTERRLLPGDSDAAWYAAVLDSALARQVPDLRRDLRQTMAAAIAEAAEQVRQHLAGPAEPFELPSAAVMLVRLDTGAEAVDYLALGDCRLITVTAGGGDAVTVGGSPLTDFDRTTAQEVAALHAAGIDEPAEVFHRLLPMVRRQRALMNRPGGYWIASLDPAAAEQAVAGRLPAAPGQPLLLLTDGLDRLSEIYRRYDPAGLLQAGLTRGLAALGDELREIETADPRGRRFPRLKPMDDASALLCRITPSSVP